MTRRLLTLALVTLAALGARAQGWSRTFDTGSPTWDDLAWAGASPDGSHLLVGSTDVFFDRLGEGVVARLDNRGLPIDAFAHGTPDREHVVGATPLPRGGAILVGATSSLFDFRTSFVTRIASDGTLAWSRTLLAPTSTQVATAFATAAMRDGRIAVAGSFSEIDAPPRHGFVVMLEADGTEAWQRMLAIDSWEQAQAVAEAGNGGLFVAGLSASAGGAGDNDLWVAKLTAAGDVEWSRTFGTADAEEATSLVALPDGGVLVGGSGVFGASGMRAPWVLRLGPTGALLWHRVGVDGQWVEGRSVAAARDGGFLILGRIETPGGTMDLWLAKISEDGALLWQRAFDSGTGDFPYTLTEARDGGLALGATKAWGFDGQDHWLLRVDGDGLISCAVASQPAVRLEEPAIQQADRPLRLVDMPFTILDAGWTSQPVPLTQAVQCDACADAGGAPPEEPSAGRPRSPWLRVFKQPSERVEVEEVAAMSALNLYVDRIGSWYAPSSATGTRCRVTSWTGSGTASIDTNIPVNSWVVVSASNACGESSAGRDFYDVERRGVGTWEACAPGP